MFFQLEHEVSRKPIDVSAQGLEQRLRRDSVQPGQHCVHEYLPAADHDDLRVGISEWIAKKFDQRDKSRLRSSLAPGPWTRELVVNVVKHAREIELIQEAGIPVLRLSDIVAEMSAVGRPVEAAAGAHLLDLVSMASRQA